MYKLFLKNIFFGITLQLFHTAVFAQEFTWKNIGYPHTAGAPYQGSTLDSSGNIFVAMEYGGIFKGSGNGKKWNHSYFSESYIFELISDRDGFTYAGVTDLGVIRTSDGGTTWEVKNVGFTSNWSIYAFGFMNDSILLAATYPPRLYSTINHGDSWTSFPEISSFTTAVGSLHQVKSGDVFMGTLDSGLFRSSDGCKTWKRINYFSKTTRISDITSLPDGKIIVAAQFEGVYSSTDNGITWKDILHSRFNFFSEVGTFSESTIICCDAVGGIYQSLNSGNDWSYLGLENVAIRSIICAPNGDVFAFPGGHTASVMPYGETYWIPLRIPNLSVLCMAAKDSTIVIGSESSLYELALNGDWSSPMSSSLETHDLLFSRTGKVFAANYIETVWKKNFGDYSWTRCPTPISGGFSCFSLAENTYGVIYAGTGGYYISNEKGSVFSSTNEGESWKDCGYNLPIGSVHKLLFTKNNTLLASIANNGIYRLQNSDTIWSAAKGFPVSDIGIMEALARDSAGNIYCGTAKYGIYISTDDGITWLQSSGSVSMNRVTDILALPNGAILATTKNGIYISNDHGKSWKSQNTGITTPYTWATTIDSKGYVYIGTYGAGIYKSDSPVTSVEANEKFTLSRFQLMQNYPNPFNPSTMISFNIPFRSYVSLKIYDAIGREICVLISEDLPAGNYERRWDATAVPTGTYFYRLQTSNFSETKKLLLIK